LQQQRSGTLKSAFQVGFFLAVMILVLVPLETGARRHQAFMEHPRQSLYPGANDDDLLGVYTFLDAQPGPLKHYQENGQSAATIIENNSLYYGISPRLHLALLETVSSLLSDAHPTDALLQQPFGPGGPTGFAAQIEWASRELRAGLGPYEDSPTIRFEDDVTITLTLEQAPEGVAVQRFLAIGRSSTEWRALVERFGQVFTDYFQNELPDLVPPPTAFTGSGFLHLPWPEGTRVVHLAYFDHVYPTVDTGGDDNDRVITYLGESSVQYNTHDGHDYYFPDQPIGTPIRAAAPGVAYARTHRGNGVVILHADGYETVYWHLDEFATLFDGHIDSNHGIWVDTGETLGTSGTTGFVYGSPHLHFEVRRHGRQVDPYGWYGPGPDPCAAYAGCAAGTWLWHSSLRGTYDFTPPDDRSETERKLEELATPDHTAPIGTLSINPPDDLLFLARFDEHVLQAVGHGFPTYDALVGFDAGRFGQSVLLPPGAGLTYPISNNLTLEAGSISLWAHLPEHYPRNSIERHYLFAASATPDDADDIYPGTLALRRDLLGPDKAPRWNFWTTPQEGAHERHDLTVPDTLEPGWHHFAITWDTEQGHKALYLDGEEVATVRNVILPVDVGSVLQIGRFTHGGSQSGMWLDELAIFERELTEDEIAELARSETPLPASADELAEALVQVDTNAIDNTGGIVALQLGLDGKWEDPQPYYDNFRWRIPPVEGAHVLGVRYFDRASNSTQLTQTFTLNLPPQGSVRMTADTGMTATLVISATDAQEPISMQISADPDFDDARWQTLRTQLEWEWPDGNDSSARDTRRTSATPDAQILYVRFRDDAGQISAPLEVTFLQEKVYLPLIVRGE